MMFSEAPPSREIADQEVGHRVGENDRDDRGEPDENRQRLLVVHVVDVAEAVLREDAVDHIRGPARADHHDAHGEAPDEELHLDARGFLGRVAAGGEQDEGDQRDAGDAVGLETVGRGADRVARIVAGAVGDHAGVTGVVLPDLEDDFHEVGADVGDLREDAAGDTQRRRAERFADREADEAGAREVARNVEQDREHDHQLDRDQHEADRHAGAQRNLVGGERLAAEAGEGGARVREGVHANAEPGHAVAARDTDEAEEEDDKYAERRHRFVLDEEPEVQNDDRADEDLQDQDELALGDEVLLAGLVDEVRNLEHRLVDRQVLQRAVFGETEEQAEGANDKAPGQDRVAGCRAAEEERCVEGRKLEAGFAGEGRVDGASGGEEDGGGKQGFTPRNRAPFKGAYRYVHVFVGPLRGYGSGSKGGSIAVRFSESNVQRGLAGAALMLTRPAAEPRA